MRVPDSLARAFAWMLAVCGAEVSFEAADDIDEDDRQALLEMQQAYEATRKRWERPRRVVRAVVMALVLVTAAASLVRCGMRWEQGDGGNVPLGVDEAEHG